MRALINVTAVLACFGPLAASAVAGWKTSSYQVTPVVQVPASGYALMPSRHHFGHHGFHSSGVVMYGAAQPMGYALPPQSYLMPSGFTAGCAGVAAPMGYYMMPSGFTAGCAGAPMGYYMPSGFTAGCAGTAGPMGYFMMPMGFSAGCAGASVPSGYYVMPSGFTAGCAGAAPRSFGIACGGGGGGSPPAPGRVTTPPPADSDLDARIARWKSDGKVSVQVDVRVSVNGVPVEPSSGPPATMPPAQGLVDRLKEAFAADRAAGAKDEDAQTIANLYRSAADKLDRGEFTAPEQAARFLSRSAKGLPRDALKNTAAAIEKHLNDTLGRNPFDTAEARARAGRVFRALANALEKAAP